MSTATKGRQLTRILGSVAAATVLAGSLSLAMVEPASASAGSCYAGYVNANKAWGQCRTASGGWGGFTLTVNCYFYPQQTSYGQAPQTIWASCPSWSHVTGIFITPAAF